MLRLKEIFTASDEIMSTKIIFAIPNLLNILILLRFLLDRMKGREEIWDPKTTETGEALTLTFRMGQVYRNHLILAETERDGATDFCDNGFDQSSMCTTGRHYEKDLYLFIEKVSCVCGFRSIYTCISRKEGYSGTFYLKRERKDAFYVSLKSHTCLSLNI